MSIEVKASHQHVMSWLIAQRIETLPQILAGEAQSIIVTQLANGDSLVRDKAGECDGRAKTPLQRPWPPRGGL